MSVQRKKFALVTGASSGIGLELCRKLAHDGFALLLVARDEARLKVVQKELETDYSITVEIFPVDLSQPKASIEIEKFVSIHDWQIEALINNAGFGDFGFFHESRPEKIASMIQVNVVALTELTRAFLPQMVQQKKGHILNLASTAAFQPGPLMAVYYATKAYVLSFTEAIANEVKDKGVIVTALCPGPTESGFQKRAEMEDSKLVRGKKMMTPKQVADLGYKAWMQGRTVEIPGVKNKLMAFSTRATPRKFLPALVRALQERAH